MLSQLKKNWLVPAIAVAAALAFAAPELGVRGGPLRPEVTTRVGVGVIFFLQGLGLSTAALRAGALRWRLHLAVQLFIFVGFPLVIMPADRLFGGALAPDLRTGFLFLAVLPTTVSMCVIFTATARGNVAAALFNSALANVAGVVLTPLLLALVLGVRGERLDVLPLVAEVAMLLLAPLLAGQLVRSRLRGRGPDAALVGTLSGIIIAFMVFTAFADSVHTGAFRQTDGMTAAVVVLAAGALFALATAAALTLPRLLGFGDDERRAMAFCAPQKTLAAGAPMAQIVFAGHAGIGLILLPLLAYHAIELVAGAALASRLGQQPPAL